jgi:preprotein translocase subunit SecD
MKKNLLWRFGLIGVILALAVIFFLPSTPIFDSMPEWWKENMPDKGIRLGLDLRGGIHLVLEVEGEKAVEASMDLIVDDLKGRLEEKKATFSSVKRIGNKISIAFPTKESEGEVKKVIEDAYPDLSYESTDEGKTLFILSRREEKRITDSAVEQALETVRNRIDEFGVAEPSIHRQAENEIVVQLPGIKDPKRALELIGRTARLEFKLLDEESEIAAQLPSSIAPGDEEKVVKEFSGKIPEGDEILFEAVKDKETKRIVSKIPYLVKKQTMMTGDLLKDARVNIDTRYNEPYVSISFNTTGARLFDKITAENVKKRLAIILDNNVYSAPVIQERIPGGNAQITGRFSMDEAKDLAIVLRAGALPAPVKVLQNVTVGPSLGQDSIDAGIRAGIIGAIAVVLFMALYYKLSGLIANCALMLNIVYLIGALASLNATLTLPGIAGVILAIGMAVDSNVLIFERIREELRAGKTVRAAVDGGFSKALVTIIDSHVTTLITATVLFQFGTGPIKGFAVTLSLGVLINLFTALVGTRVVYDLILSRWRLKRLSI